MYFPNLGRLGLFRMLEDIQNVSLPCQKIDYVRDDLSKVGTMDAGNNKERYGYNGILITRPAFYDILLSRVPAHRIHWGKRILGFEQNQYGVMIRVADNSTHHADILIGAGETFVDLPPLPSQLSATVKNLQQ